MSSSNESLSNVLVIGVFDLFHRGHLELLRSARNFGDSLHVIVNGDDLTTRYKRKPFYSEQDRLEIVSALRFVDRAVISNDFDVKPYLERFRIDAIVHGDDWAHDDYLRQIQCTPEYIQERRIKMIYTPYYKGVSTSSTIKKLSATCAV